jgi:hypothetical protein
MRKDFRRKWREIAKFPLGYLRSSRQRRAGVEKARKLGIQSKDSMSSSLSGPGQPESRRDVAPAAKYLRHVTSNNEQRHSLQGRTTGMHRTGRGVEGDLVLAAAYRELD